MRELEVLPGLDHAQRMGGMDPLLHMRKLAQEGKVSQKVLENFEATSSTPSLNDALMSWLQRTPINGSLQGEDGDDEVIAQFVEGHLDAMKRHGEEVISHIVAIGHGEESQVRPRIEGAHHQAESFLKPEGVVSRARAGLLFIESYPELPLLSWPRRLIDAFVGLEQSMILFRSAHARMVERMIGRRMGTGGSSGVDYLDATTKYRVFVDLWAVRTMLVKRDALNDVSESGMYGFSMGE
jgi:tryptophan 2,3-dioxygenase